MDLSELRTKCIMKRAAFLPLIAAAVVRSSTAFHLATTYRQKYRIQGTNLLASASLPPAPDDPENGPESPSSKSRRAFVKEFSAGAAVVLSASHSQPSHAAVGTLPEFSDTNAVLQGVTILVADSSQQTAMVKFLEDGFECKVLRQRIQGSVEEIWMGFGPEQLSIPTNFVTGVSSFGEYGGHASIRIVYDKKTTTPLYRTGEAAPGNNIAYLQLGVPEYRISQMVKNGGNILDAYGIVNVVSPSGLPIRGIVGISPDPIMFIAINCQDVKKSRAFYEQLGFVEQEYPYCRPNKGKGQFEPEQPAKSVYLAPSPNSFGVLLLPSRKVTPNPVVQSLGVVYTPSSDADAGDTAMRVVDPSGVAYEFQSVSDFETTERITR